MGCQYFGFQLTSSFFPFPLVFSESEIFFPFSAAFFEIFHQPLVGKIQRMRVLPVVAHNLVRAVNDVLVLHLNRQLASCRGSNLIALNHDCTALRP